MLANIGLQKTIFFMSMSFLMLLYITFLLCSKLSDDLFVNHVTNDVFHLKTQSILFHNKDSLTMPTSRIDNSKSFDFFFSKGNLNRANQWTQTHKRILFWTSDRKGQRYHDINLGRDVFRKADCPVWQCEAYDTVMMNLSSKDTPKLEEYDAVVFLDQAWVDRSFPAKRSPHQRYVFLAEEAPWAFRPFFEAWDKFSGFFNWTMTYRWDSDIANPYGWISPINNDFVPRRLQSWRIFERLLAKEQPTNHAEGKTKMAAWFVSNCHAGSGRSEYVERLKQFVQVDIYGKCGNLSCSRDNDISCRHILERDYKFYLSFENSLCVDYVTEKFFTTMKYNIVPVVLDLHDNHRDLAPPHSYINALDFSSVRDLANYLTKLDKDDTLYNEYFWWKKHYVVHGGEYKHSLCGLCSRLHEPDQPKTFHSDLIDWWVNESQCYNVRFAKHIFSNESSAYDESFVWHIVPQELII